MNFKRKAGAAILVFAVASVIAVPGAAMAVEITPTIQKDATTVTYNLDSTDNDAVTITDTDIKVVVNATQLKDTFSITFPTNYDDNNFTIFFSQNSSGEIVATHVSSTDETVGKLVKTTEETYVRSTMGGPSSKVVSSVLTITDTEADEAAINKLLDSHLDLTGVVIHDPNLFTLNVSKLTALTSLDISGCSKLNSLTLPAIDNGFALASLNIDGTQLASLDASGSSASLDIYGSVALDDTQDAVATVNAVNSSYNDYTFDLGDVTNGMAEYINSDAVDFKINTSNGVTVYGNNTTDGTTAATNFDDLMTSGWFNYSDGVLTITAKDVPTSITYSMGANNSSTDANYDVTFYAGAVEVSSAKEITALETALNSSVPSNLSVSFTGDDLDQDDIEDFLSASSNKYAKMITGTLTITNSDIDDIDVSDAVNASALVITGNDLETIDGLDDFGSNNSNGSVTMDIIASELDSIDFGDNDAIGKVAIDSDLESIDVSGLDYLTTLNVSGCSELTSLDVSDNDKLDSLNIRGTQLAYLDTSETNITIKMASDATWSNTKSGQGLYVGSGLTLDDDQYASVTENDDDDDYNDYVFDLDDITGGNGEDVSDTANNFTIVTTDKGATVLGGDSYSDNLYDDDDWFDYDDGDLTITAKDTPDSIQYTIATDDDYSVLTYTVKFSVESEGLRISGDDRYDTMIQIDTNEDSDDFDDVFDGTKDIVVASGEGYADALSASALAGALDTGIVTTKSDSLTDDTIDMLEDMDDQDTAYIVGGTSVVSYAVEQQLTDLGFSIKRFSGSDRYDTAVDVQDKIQDMIDDGDATSNDKTVIIASGVSYADALAIAPYAYTQHMPIVLVDSDGQMDDETADLFSKYKTNYKNAIIVGGTSVISDDVVDTFEGYSMDVIRLAGDDRYETNLVINDWLDRGESSISGSDDIFEDAGYSDDDIDDFNDADIQAVNDANDFDGMAYVVTGRSYADALAVAPLAGVKGGTINMVSSDDITTVTEAKDNGASTTIIGGTSAVSSDLANEIDDL